MTNEFVGCSKLDTITLPDTLRTLGTSAFTGSGVVLDLSDCSYITDLIIDSDNIIEVMPAPNDNLESVTYDAGSSKIKMVGYSKAVLKMNNEEEITDFWVENCDGCRNSLSRLYSIYSKDEHALRYIRAIGFDEHFWGDGGILDTLIAFAENGYHGINDGNRDDDIIPVLSGKLHCTANYSPDKLYSLESYFPQIQFNMTGIAYIDFKDSVVKKICVQNWGYGSELTAAQAATVTSLGAKFKENSEITSFDELKYFVSSQSDYAIGLYYGTFAGCANLESVTLMPTIKQLDGAVFYGCTSLKSIVLPDTIEVIKSAIFSNCTSLLTANIPLGLTITELPSDLFRDCVSLTSLMVIPEKITSIGMRAFTNCRSLEGVKMLGTTPPTLGYAVFDGATFPIYVPQKAVNTYKSASGWTSISSRIIGY